MTNKLTDLHVNHSLLDMIRAGAKVVLPISNSLMAKLTFPRAMALTKAMNVDPPYVAAPSAGPWVSPAYRSMTDHLVQSGFQAIDVDLGSAFIDHVRRRWGRALSDYQSLNTLVLPSPWPSWTRQGCSNDIAITTTMRSVKAAFPNDCVIIASWGTHLSPLPETAVTGGFVRWTPMAHHNVEDLLSMAEGVEFDNNPCRICRLCPMQSATSIREEASEFGPHLIQSLLDFEAETTFPFSDRHWLGELIASELSAAQLECHARTQQRAATRGAAEMLIPAARRDMTASQMTPISLLEAGAIATSRQLVSESLGINIKHQSPEDVREALNRRFASMPPIKLSMLLSNGYRPVSSRA